METTLTNRTKAEEIIHLWDNYLTPNYAPSLCLSKGKGCKVWDTNNKFYLDFIAGIAVNSLGHAHPAICHAINKQSRKLMHVSNLYYTEPAAKLAKTLSEASLGGKVFFCNSGAEANEALFKLAKLAGTDQGRTDIITFSNSFHGRTLGGISATGQEKVKVGFEPLMDCFKHARFNQLDSVKELISGKTAAILVEPIQGEGGIHVATPEFMLGLRALCDEHKILLLVDEIQCGLGRTGKMFAYEHYGILPDAIALAKGLGGGFPIGALVTNEKYADCFQPGSHGTTFGGNPLACVAAQAVLDTIDNQKLCQNAEKLGNYLLEKLGHLKVKFPEIKEVRGKGLMLGIVFDRPCKDLERIMQRRGLLTLATAENVIRLLPPLVVNKSQVNKALSIFKKSCLEWKTYFEEGTV